MKTGKLAIGLALIYFIPLNYAFANTRAEIIARHLDRFEFADEVSQHKDMERRRAFGYRYGFINVDDADIKKQGTGGNRNCHSYTLTYDLSEKLALEWEWSSFRLISKVLTRVKAYSIGANLLYKLDTGNITPYITTGLGIQHYRYSNIGTDDRKGHSFSHLIKSGGGLDYFLNKGLALNGEISYVYGNTGGDATLDVYQWRYSGGLKCFF